MTEFLVLVEKRVFHIKKMLKVGGQKSWSGFVRSPNLGETSNIFSYALYRVTFHRVRLIMSAPQKVYITLLYEIFCYTTTLFQLHISTPTIRPFDKKKQ